MRIVMGYQVLIVVVSGLIGASGSVFGQVSSITDEQARSSGSGHSWQGRLPGVNLYSLARQTDLPLTGWRMRGRMSVAFSLHHNSQAVYSNPNLGNKWSHTYDIHLDRWNEAGVEKAALVGGNHLIQMFTLQAGQWVPADGYRDTLENFGSGYRVRRKNQVILEFELSLLANRFRLKRIRDPNNNTLTLTYDASGRLTTIADPDNRKIRLIYDALTSLMTKVKFQVGSWNRTWTLLHDPANRLNKIKYPSVTTDAGPAVYHVRLAYNANDNVTSLTDPTGQVWKYAYDAVALNRLKSEQWPGNSATQKMIYTYSSATERKVKDPNGVEVGYIYDAGGRVLSQIKDALNHTTTLTYTDPDYDWMPSQITYPMSIQYQYDYDTNGNVVGYTDPSGSRWDYAYDSLNDLIQALQPLVTDAWGVPEPARHRTDYSHDPQGNLSAVRRYKDAVNYAETTYAYDSFGNRVQQTDPLGRVTTYTYDAYGNLTHVTTPAGRTGDWFYSSAAQTHGFTLPDARMDGTGTLINLLYDERGRLRTVDVPFGADTTYSYDANSRLVRMADGTGATDWTYTPQGWLASEVRAGMSVQYAYLPNGLRMRMETQSAMGGRVIDYTYDALNHLTQLMGNGGLNLYTYDAASRLIARQSANGARMECGYLGNRLASVRHYDAANVPFRTFNYDYQANGILRSVAELDGSMTRYGYDFLNRFTREERTGSTLYAHEWSWDDADNRTWQNEGGILTLYQYDLDNLLMTADRMGSLTTYLRDAAGRVIERDRAGVRHQFQYDAEGHLTRLDEWDGSAWRPSRIYSYDGLGRRVRRETFTGGVFTDGSDFLYDGAHLALEEINDAIGGMATVWNVRAGDLLAVHDTRAGSRWCATDGMGGLRGWADGGGNPGVYQSVHNAFGAVIWEMGHRPAYGWGADSCVRTEGDAGLMYQDSVGWYDPIDANYYLEQPTTFYPGIMTGEDGRDLSVRISAAPLIFQDEPIPVEIVSMPLQSIRPVQDAKPIAPPAPKAEEPDPNEFPPTPPPAEPPPPSKPDPEEEMQKMLEERHREFVKREMKKPTKLPFRGKPRGVHHKGLRAGTPH